MKRATFSFWPLSLVYSLINTESPIICWVWIPMNYNQFFALLIFLNKKKRIFWSLLPEIFYLFFPPILVILPDFFLIPSSLLSPFLNCARCIWDAVKPVLSEKITGPPGMWDCTFPVSQKLQGQVAFWPNPCLIFPSFSEVLPAWQSKVSVSFFPIFLPNHWTVFGDVAMLISVEVSDLSFLYYFCQLSSSLEGRASYSIREVWISQVI